jgi:hypothetical protein
MKIHENYLELAAAQIDFGLDAEERASLDGHLAGCTACRRAVHGLLADQMVLGDLPPIALADSQVDRIWRRLGRSRPSSSQTVLRLVAIAALLALAIQAALVVGSQLQIRSEPVPIVPDGLLGKDAPGPSTSTETLDAGRFALGSVVRVVVTDLRVRTAPTVDNSKSVKLDPLLGTGVRLRVVDGPVRADDYDWYLVQALDLPHQGWVASADHDGEPWIEAEGASAPPTFSPEEDRLVARLRADAAVRCAPRRDRLPDRATAGIECRIASGLVERVGVYRFGSPDDAAAAYFARLASYGVKPATGSCADGRVGDSSWSARGRSGCFVDENGNANVRATCGATYVGVLGRSEAISDLYAWTWKPTKSSSRSSPPGVCASVD